MNSVGVELPSTVAFDYPSVAAIGRFVEGRLFPDGSSNATGFLTEVPAAVAGGGLLSAAALAGVGGGDWVAQEVAVRTAVTGMGLRLPRTTSDAQSYWELLANGGDCVTKVRGDRRFVYFKLLLETREALSVARGILPTPYPPFPAPPLSMQVPLDRWDVDLATSSGIIKRRRDPLNEKYSRHGSFVRDFDLFDNAFFCIPEKEAGEIDPQQRVLIQVCAEALSNGGFAPHGWQSTNTAVYVGAKRIGRQLAFPVAQIARRIAVLIICRWLSSHGLRAPQNLRSVQQRLRYPPALADRRAHNRRQLARGNQPPGEPHRLLHLRLRLQPREPHPGPPRAVGVG